MIAGGIVSTLTSPLVRSARVTIPAYPVEFLTKISNVARPFVSFSYTVFVKVILLPDILELRLVSPNM